MYYFHSQTDVGVEYRSPKFSSRARSHLEIARSQPQMRARPLQQRNPPAVEANLIHCKTSLLSPISNTTPKNVS